MRSRFYSVKNHSVQGLYTNCLPTMFSQWHHLLLSHFQFILGSNAFLFFEPHCNLQAELWSKLSDLKWSRVRAEWISFSSSRCCVSEPALQFQQVRCHKLSCRLSFFFLQTQLQAVPNFKLYLFSVPLKMLHLTDIPLSTYLCKSIETVNSKANSFVFAMHWRYKIMD